MGSRTRASAEKFGDEHKVPQGKRYDSYDALLADNDVRAVYISLPNHLHARWAIRCAEAKKHILLEKPFTLNFGEAVAVVEAAQARRHRDAVVGQSATEAQWRKDDPRARRGH